MMSLMSEYYNIKKIAAEYRAKLTFTHGSITIGPNADKESDYINAFDDGKRVQINGITREEAIFIIRALRDIFEIDLGK
jgi:hypothetical protein